MEIVPLSPEVWPAFAEFFATDGGADSRWCWCQYWRKPGTSWTNTTPEDNRQDLEALVREGPPPGLVAMRDGVAVGWVGLGPREGFPRHARSRTIPQLPGDDVWVINCFVVAKAARGSGVGSALLDAAVSYAGEHGARLVEGYPVETDGGLIASAAAFMGTARMFDRAGFETASTTTSTSEGGRSRVVMRRKP